MSVGIEDLMEIHVTSVDQKLAPAGSGAPDDTGRAGTVTTLTSRFRDCSIRCKIICIALTTCAASLLTFWALFMASGAMHAGQHIRNNPAFLAQMAGPAESYLLILFGALLMAYLISSRLQRIISEPILQLACIMKQVTENHCYSLRARYSSKDELGELLAACHEMLDGIERRDNLLSKQRDELEARVAERTAELRAALEAAEAAEAASFAKSQFLANMSHEIRTTMSGVLGMAELLLKSTREGKQRHYAETVCKSSQSLLCIINDILDISKIEAGKLELETSPFEIRQLVHDVVELFAQNARRKGIAMGWVVAAGVPAVVAGDMGRIRQVLSNLVGNAAKFTDRGEILVCVRLQQETADGCVIRFEISDTGIGIPLEACSQIFNRFSQGDNSMTRQYGGTGLGLTIAKELTEMMGGSIGVKSAPGQGSTFWFTVTLQKQPLHDPLRRCSPALPGGPQIPGDEADDSPLLGRVLLAEDNPVNQEVALAMLHSFGCEVDLAENGEEAVAAWQRKAYDLILMDDQMPVMDGCQASIAIRAREEAAGDGRRVAIVALTGHAQQEDRRKCQASGMDDYLSKPFSTLQLRAVVARWLAVRQHTAIQPLIPAAPATEEGGDRSGVISGKFLSSIKNLQVPGQPDLLDKVIGSYLRDSEQLRQTMRQGLSSADLESVQRAAHTHKSSSGALGALTLAELCKELEKQCREKSQEAACRLVQQIDALSEEVREELENIKENCDGCSG